MTRLLGPRPTEMMRSTRHSRLVGASTRCGARTLTPGAAVRPVKANSSTAGGYSPDVRFMCSASGSSTTLTTKSPECSMLVTVSFLLPSRRLDENAIVGGSLQTPMKNENGARLYTPSALTVDTHAMGRGTTQPIKSL